MQKKMITKFVNNFEKPYFWPPIFFFKSPAPSCINSCEFLLSFKDLEKKLMIKENVKKDERMEGRVDHILEDPSGYIRVSSWNI